MDGLERLELLVEPDRVTAASTVVCLEAGGFRLDHRWILDGEWRAQSVVVELWNARGHKALNLERAGEGWRVNGRLRPDLHGADEPDLSVTPFCNTFPIRRLRAAEGERMALDVAYIDGTTLAVSRSRQQYERLGPTRVHYTDLGLSLGFEADLELDDAGLVLNYQHLFERVSPLGRQP